MPARDLLLLPLLLGPCSALFPRPCTNNASRPNAVCCPPSPSDPAGPVCGGPPRGECRRLSGPLVPQLPRTPVSLRDDDRLDWPLRFFRSACACRPNFWGYACHLCRPGWGGADCNRRETRVRRNVFSLSASERRLFRDVIDQAKREPSDWAVLNISSSADGDPITKLTPPLPFFKVSVYDYLVYLHVYAARSTMLTDDMEVCPGTQPRLDFAHSSIGFVPWHRYYLMVVEAEFDAIARARFGATRPFALPYWDWVDAPDCTVCTNDLVGATNRSDPLFRLDLRSPFAGWRGFCDMRAGEDECHVCDPERQQPFLWRVHSEVPFYSPLPKQRGVDYALDLKTYDLRPFDQKANASSFRNVLEGFIDEKNDFNDSDVGRPYLHNLVHSYMNGTWFDVATSPNDPLFWLHHSFVDKLMELWIRRWGINLRDLPLYVSPGHGRLDPMVPFFPPVLLEDYMVTSKVLGYDFDDEKAGTFNLQATALATEEETNSASWLKTWTIVEGALLGLFVVGIVTFLVIRWRRSRSTYDRLYEYVETSTPDESTRLIDDSGQPQSHRQRRSKRQSAQPAASSGAEHEPLA